MPSPTVSRAAAGLPPSRKSSSPQVVTLLQARIPVGLRLAMERRATAEGTSLNKLMQKALRKFLDAPAAPVAEPERDESAACVVEPEITRRARLGERE